MTPTTKMPVATDRLLKASEAAEFLRVSLSWLAKRRASGDAPPFVRMGRTIRYSQLALLHWTKSRQQLSIREG
jgi:predicted DNA-binding transcriptional regulator AlpA